MNWFRRTQRTPQEESEDELDYGEDIPWPYQIAVFADDPLLRQLQQEAPVERLDRKILAWADYDRRTVAWDPFRKERLLKLGKLYLKRFFVTDSINDLNNAIDRLEHTARRSKPADIEWLTAKLELAFALTTRFDLNKSVDDLDRAISTREEAISYTPLENRHMLQFSHSCNLQMRFDLTGSLEHSDKAIEMLLAIATSALDMDDRAKYLSKLGSALQSRFKETQNIEELERGIEFGRQATQIKLRRTGNNQRSLYFSTLGMGLWELWGWKSTKDNLNNAITAYEKAIDYVSKGSTTYLTLQSNLAILLRERFKQDGRSKDFKRSIELSKNAVDCTPNGSASRAGRLINLATTLSVKWDVTGLPEDLESAIQAARLAIECVPEDSQHRGTAHGCLGLLLQTRFDLSGSIEDLNGAIEAGEVAVGAATDGLSKARELQALADAHQRRYDWLESTDSLDRAIKLYEQALQHTMSPDSQAGLYFNLSNALRKRFERFQDKKEDNTDLTRAIEAAEKSMERARRTNSRVQALMALAAGLHKKGNKTQDLRDLDEAIEAYERAISTAPKQSPSHGALYNNLGTTLRTRYNLSSSIEDLEYMVNAYKKALSMAPEGHPDRSLYMNNLGGALADFSGQKQSSKDRGRAIDLLSKAALDHSLPVSYRIITLIRAANLTHDIQRVTEFMSLAVNLMPILSSRALATIDRQFKVAKFKLLASAAAALVLESKQPPLEAINVLEIGRGIILNGYLETRSDITLLKESNPVLGHHLEQLQRQLDPHNLGSDTRSICNESIKSYATKVSRFRIVERYEETLREIRALPGFKRFLLGPSLEELVSLACDGPIVILNTNPIRCDAIIVKGDKVYLLHLPDLRFEDVSKKAGVMRTLLDQGRTVESNKALREILQWLWDAIAKPVLTNLGFNGTPAEGIAWPRMWWVPTGMLTLFPIHAAGYHAVDSQETVLDRVVSCYAPTIKTLGYVRKRKDRVRREFLPSIFLAAMSETPGGDWALPDAAEEVSAIANLIPESVPTHILHQPTKSQVLEALRTHSMAHFACHGRVDIEDPSKSMLMLSDWESEPLSVGSIVSLQLDNVAFAYLSACHSADNQALELIDEGIHMAGALQLAGYPQVVSTLWYVEDGPSKGVSESVYRAIVREGLGELRVAEALNSAVRKLRGETRHEEGSTIVYDDEPMIWAPYIYMGA